MTKEQLTIERQEHYQGIIEHQLCIDGINKQLGQKFDFEESLEGQVYGRFVEHFDE